MNIIAFFYSRADPGNANSDLINLFEELRQRHQIHFFSFSKGTNKDNLIHHAIPSFGFRLNSFLFGFFHMLGILMIAREIHKIRADFIIADSVIFTLLPSYILSKIYRIPMTVYCRELVPENPYRKKTVLNILKNITAKSLNNIRDCIVSKSKLVVAMDEGLMRYFQDKTGKQVYLVPSSIDFSLEYKDIRNELGLPADKTLVLYTGSYHTFRGLDLLIESFSKIKRDDVLLVFGGWKHDKDIVFLNDLIKKFGIDKSVAFLPRLPYDKVPSLIYSCDICVEPWNKTGLQEFQISLKLLDYLSVGKPAVAINVSGNRLLIQDGYNGLLSRYDAGDFAEKLLLLINNPGLRHKLGENARKTAIEKYDSRIVANEFEYLVRTKLFSNAIKRNQ